MRALTAVLIAGVAGWAPSTRVDCTPRTVVSEAAAVFLNRGESVDITIRVERDVVGRGSKAGVVFVREIGTTTRVTGQESQVPRGQTRVLRFTIGEKHELVLDPADDPDPVSGKREPPGRMAYEICSTG